MSISIVSSALSSRRSSPIDDLLGCGVDPGRDRLAPAGVDVCDVEGEGTAGGRRELILLDFAIEADKRGLSTDLADLTRC